MRVLVLGLLTTSATAHAETALRSDAHRDAATARGRVELRVGAQNELETSARFSEDTPAIALTLGGGYFLADNVVLGIGGAVGVGEADADTQELYAHAAVFYRLPIMRAFAGARAGYYRTEVRGSDFTFDDRGPRFALDVGFRLAIPRSPTASVFAEPTVTCSLIGSSSIHDERNSSFPAWTRSLVIGVAVPVSF